MRQGKKREAETKGITLKKNVVSSLNVNLFVLSSNYCMVNLKLTFLGISHFNHIYFTRTCALQIVNFVPRKERVVC